MSQQVRTVRGNMVCIAHELLGLIKTIGMLVQTVRTFNLDNLEEWDPPTSCNTQG
eukprot:m.13484 g.13484  ORF g.13484 m.13484 type:complete len:55 (+) comp10134_c0_seq1:43-207(+)